MVRLGDVDAAALEAAEVTLRACEVKPGDVLLAPGESPDLVGLVREGALRELYVLPDGTERTRAFCTPGEFFGSLSEAIAGRASRSFIQAESRARLVWWRWTETAKLEERFPAWRGVVRRALEELFLKKSEREYELLALDALERYRALRARSPKLEALVPQRLIASYLGITPVHLSRIRRRLRPRQA